jgi:transcriptional regulator with XRE-family HTH domain
MTLEVNIREVARGKGVKSAKQLGDLAQVPYNVITRYWQGGQMERVNLTVLVAVAKALGVKALDLLEETED